MAWAGGEGGSGGVYRRSGQGATGSGLGLAMVRSVAQRHHAVIRLDETPGGGLTVRVSFPDLPAAH